MSKHESSSFFRSIVVATIVCASLFVGVCARAADFPKRPVRLIVAFPPGGGVDTVARVVSNELAKQLGHSVVIENVVGAGGYAR